MRGMREKRPVAKRKDGAMPTFEDKCAFMQGVVVSRLIVQVQCVHS